jgi:hypothetical protein
VLISFEDGATLAMKMSEESNSKQPNSNTHARAENRGRDDGASRRVLELCGAVTPSGWHSAGSVLDGIGRMTAGQIVGGGQIDKIVILLKNPSI